MLLGRAAEQTRIDRLLADARSGHSGVIVVLGQAGIGKTALLEYAAGNAGDLRVLRCAGVESEAELPYAGLHMLVGSFTDRLRELPAPQATALRHAFGQADATAVPDRFLVGLATLSLLAELAEERPVLCLIDDAHWLDAASADALLFAARRLGAEPIGLIFAAREEPSFPAPDAYVLRPAGLDAAAGRDLLAEHAGDLAGPVRDRVLAEAQGNPLAMVELARALTPEQRAGDPRDALGIGVLPVSDRIEQAFAGRVHALSRPAQDLLLVAAADASGDLDVVRRAGALLGATPSDLEVAEDQGLLRVNGGRLVFTHPLIRSAAYQATTSGRRAAAHRALASSYDGVTGADRRAWHLAAAATGVDEAAAAELERTAEHARERGGFAAVAAAYERSAELTPDPGRRASRLAAAARAAANAGRSRLAAGLAERAARHDVEPEVRAELTQVRTEIAHEQDLPIPSREVAEAAAAIAGRSPDRAALMLLDTVMAMLARSDHDAIAELAEQVAGLRSSAPLLTGVSVVVTGLAQGDTGHGVKALREVLTEPAYGRRTLKERLSLQSWFLLLDDVDGAYASASALVEDCRKAGAIGLLPRAFLQLGRAQLLLGRFRELRALALEGSRIADDTAQPHFAGHLCGLLASVAAIEGAEDRCLALAHEILGRGVTERGAESVYALTVLDLALGRNDAAFERLERIAEGPFRHLVTIGQCLPDYVEAAVRAGRTERGAELCDGLQLGAGQAWSEAVALRCRALVVGRSGEAADLYERAVRLHAQGGPPFARARTELLYGEWLRREKRRADSRPRLRAALETFEGLGAVPWAERARSELRAAGETPQARDRAADHLESLTPQELQVVRLAATGMSNRDIGAQMFLSPRTVGYHLYKAYPKLGIASRTELMRMHLDP